MATKYKITWTEDGSSQVKTGEEIHAEYGGLSERDAFLEALLSSPVLQSSLYMEVEALSPETVYEEAVAVLGSKRKEVAAAKADVDEAVVEILASITKAQLDKGEVHKLGKAADSKYYNLVEYWVAKSALSLATVIKDHKGKLPTHVYEELLNVKERRKRKDG